MTTPVTSRNDIRCAICIDTLKSDEFKELPCFHLFHKACIDPWEKKRNSCPTCRTQINKSKITPLDLSDIMVDGVFPLSVHLALLISQAISNILAIAGVMDEPPSPDN